MSGDLLGDDMPRPGEGDDRTAYIASRDDNSYSVVTIAGANVTLNGLTITAGERGTETSIDIIDFSLNIRSGAGLYAMQGATGTVVSNCNFTNNSLTVPGAGFFEFAYGGGAFFQEGATLTNCTFTGNSAEPTGLEVGEAIMFGGGLAFFQGAMATLTGCVFENNNAVHGGGAFFFEEATLTNCVFANNNAADTGGGLQLAGGTVTNSTFYNNTVAGRGGGITVFFNDTDADITGVQTIPFNLQNSILVGNTVTTAGNAIYLTYEVPISVTDIEAVMDHNLIGGGVAAIDLGLFDGNAGTYTDGQLANATNVALTNTIEESNAAVVFASTDATNANFLRLADDSPAVGAGENSYIPGGITTDAADEVRIQSGTVDLGAYESTLLSQAITFDDPTGGATVEVVGETLDLMATTNVPGLFVTFSIGTVPANGVATLTDNMDGTGMLVLTGVGTVTVTASRAEGESGGITYPPATSVTHTITVRPAGAAIFRATTAGTGNGSSWTQAMALQAALEIAIVAGDQIWIAAGTYTPHADNRTATFRIPGDVLVYGGFDPVADATDSDATSRSGRATILSGDLADDDLTDREEANYTLFRNENSYSVVTIAGANVTLNGLTIEGGERGAEIIDLGTSHLGAGLYAGTGTTGITLTACAFNNNSADDSGGGAYFTERATLTGCTFNNNSVGDDGGGVYFFQTATLTNGVFADNNAIDDGGGAYFNATATLTGCNFNNNNSDYWGGGALFDGAATLTNCTFTENTANGGFSEGGGGTL